MTDASSVGGTPPYRTYIILGIIAASVSAATAAVIVWSRHRRAIADVDTVQAILDRCHDQVREIERRLLDLPHVSRPEATAS